MTTQVKFEMFLPSFCPVPLLVQHFVLVPLLEKDKREMAIKNHIYIYICPVPFLVVQHFVLRVFAVFLLEITSTSPWLIN